MSTRAHSLPLLSSLLQTDHQFDYFTLNTTLFGNAYHKLSVAARAIFLLLFNSTFHSQSASHYLSPNQGLSTLYLRLNSNLITEREKGIGLDCYLWIIVSVNKSFLIFQSYFKLATNKFSSEIFSECRKMSVFY